MTETLLPIVQKINGYLSDYILVALLIAVGLWYSIKTRFVQVRHFKEGWNSVFGSLSLRGGKQESGMSSFQALAPAIAAQVGTGNIVGASGAILTGGPGAIFWMWVIAFLGMATIYAEATLAQETRTVDKDGIVLGGPVYYITTAFKGGFGKFLAGFFAVAISLALGFFGCMVQSNSIAHAMQPAFNVPAAVSGVVCAVLAGLVFFSGVGRLASFTEKIVPFMAAIYLIGGLWVIGAHITEVIPAFRLIFVAAFDPEAVMGGAVGVTVAKAMQFGGARGLFSNEAGMGSTPHAHAVARVKHPAEQGLAAIIGLFIDTFIVVNMTAFEILCTGSLDGTTTGIALTQKAFTLGLGTIGNGFVAVCLLFFAFTTIVGWYFFAEQNVKYLVGVRYVSSYRVLVLAFIMAGSFLHVTLVWELADLFNGLMAIPNIIALIGLSKVVGRALEDYEKKFLAGETPEFGELAPVPADIPRYNGAPAQDPALEPKPQHHRRLGGLRNRFRRRPHNAQENDA